MSTAPPSIADRKARLLSLFKHSAEAIFLDTADTIRVRISAEQLNRIRKAFWAATVLPVTSAARHGVLCLLIFWACAVPYRYLAACTIVAFSLFPVTSAALVVTCVWSVGGITHAVTCSGVTRLVIRRAIGILSLPLVCSCLRSETEQSLESHIGVSSEVFSFSVFLGVHTFGAPGILFGPALVCGSKRLIEMLTRKRVVSFIARSVLSPSRRNSLAVRSGERVVSPVSPAAAAAQHMGGYESDTDSE